MNLKLLLYNLNSASTHISRRYYSPQLSEGRVTRARPPCSHVTRQQLPAQAGQGGRRDLLRQQQGQ